MGEGGGGPTNRGESGEDDAPVDKMERLRMILDQFEITIAEANDLVVLADYEIVVIADDSGSMSMASLPPAARTLGAAIPTRWDELKETCKLLVELGNCFDESGLDIFFLNRPQLKEVKGAMDPAFVEAFSKRPAGSTPLTECLRGVVAATEGERPVLLFIMTDGEPNGGSAAFAKEMERLVKKQSTSRTFKVQIMACTDEDEAVGWLNDMDEKFTAVDVTDDYYSEKAEVLAAGKVPKFTRGDWLIKALLGPVSSKFDAWDEGPKGGKGGKAGGDEKSSSSCTLL